MDTGSATLEQQYNGAILGDTHNAATVAASNTSTRSASGGPPRPMMSEQAQVCDASRFGA